MDDYLLIPGVLAATFFCLVAYMQRQVRAERFRVWQLGWAAYLLHILLQHGAVLLPLWWWLHPLSGLALLAAPLTLLGSSRNGRHEHRFRRDLPGLAAAGAGVLWIFAESLPQTAGFFVRLQGGVELGMALLLGLTSYRFARQAGDKSSTGWNLMSLALAAGSLTLFFMALAMRFSWHTGLALHLVLGMAQGMLGMGMVLAITEYENHLVRESSIALSALGVEGGVLLTPEALAPAMSKMLSLVLRSIHAERGILYIAEAWRGLLPSVEQNLPDSLNVLLQHGSAGEELCRQAMRRGGVTQWRQEKYPQLRAGTWQIGAAAEFFGAGGQESWTAVALESRGDLMGMILFPHPARRRMSASELRVLLTQALQLAKTLDNYVLVEDALHRSRESEMMTQVGQAISSHLDPDEVLKAIHLELGKLFDTGTFYVAFLDGDMLHYEFETVEGIVQPKRAVRLSSSLAAHILESGEPLLIRSAVAERKKQLHITSPGRGAKSFLGVPVKMSGRTAGVLCALNFEREFVYSQRDLEVLQTAAGQLSVAMENALLFSEANRRAQYLSFLNTIAGVAISTQETGQMLGEIVRRIEENFGFDHVSVGLLDYARKDIEIRAEAGGGATLQGHRIPIGVGIMGRVARSNETAVVQHTGEPNLLGVLNGARSVLCMPLHYGGTLLGLLNVESLREDAFTAQDVLLFNTLADLLSTALNNSLAFQELQQQAITDGLTGLKTRRYFLENLHAECRRAKRSGRPFAVLLLDLDKFKQVNDTQGHLQGDLVLARVGWILEMKCRQSNVVARYGGDEFVVLMPESEMEPAETLADRLRLCFLSDPMLQEHGVTGSFGVAVFPQHGETAEEILRTADDGMYQSKHNGGNCVSVSRAGHGSDPVRERGQYLTSYLESFCTESILDEESAQEFVATVQRALEALPEPGRGQLALDLLCRMVRVAERRENDRGSHGEDVAAYAEVIGRRLDLAAGELQALHTAGLLHDIGKLFIPASILNSTGMLGTAEYQLVMTHSRIGARLAGLLSQGAEIQDWILHHHERMDGSGYPDQLAGENISLGARILGICDAYVIMTSEHPFSAALSPAEALHELEISPQLYDPALVAIFASHVRGEGTPHAILT